MPTEEDVQKAKERVMSGEGYIHIKRVPGKTVCEFLEYANSSEFGVPADWGMAFKKVWDFFCAYNPRDNEMLLQAQEELLYRIRDLEAQVYEIRNEIEPKKGVKKTVSGKTIGG